MDTSKLPYPKPEPRQRGKALARRHERVVITGVRESCVKRDGRCRLAGHREFGRCDGPSEWAHMPSHRRSRTMRMAPTERHGTRWSLMLCREHHSALDGRILWLRLQIAPLTNRGCDGPLRFWRGETYWDEPA